MYGRVISLLAIGAIALAGMVLPVAAHAPHGSGAPSIQILSPGNQAMVAGTFALKVKVSNFILRPDLVGKAPTAGMGHYHILVDGVYNTYSATTTGVAMNLKPGRHQVMVILANNNHTIYPIPATSSIVVQVGPAIQITSPTQGAAINSTVTLHVRFSHFKVSGQDLGHAAKVGEGHWHVLVDGMYATASTASTATLSGLAPGPHMIEAQLANNDHSPLAPPAYYDLFVTVRGGPSSTTSPGSTPTATASPAASSTPTGAPAANSTPTSGPSTSGSTQFVSIKNFAFAPASLTISVGTSVEWINKDSIAHTATGDGGTFDSGSLDQGGHFTFTFTKPGTYNYGCSIHPNMRATIIVQ